MLSPRFAKVMLERYRKENPMGIADSTFRGAATRALETKFGWGHEAWTEELASEIEKMHFDPTWSSQQILNYVSKYVRSCNHQNPSSVSHQRKNL
jgi:hypothetical protein